MNNNTVHSSDQSLLRDRDTRLSQNVMILFHVTTVESACEMIESESVRSNRSVLKGSQGMEDGGIHFSISKEDAKQNSKHHNVVLKCSVKLGRVKIIERSGDITTAKTMITFILLLREGFDSVVIERQNEIDYVVHNEDQVEIICSTSFQHSSLKNLIITFEEQKEIDCEFFFLSLSFPSVLFCSNILQNRIISIFLSSSS